MELRSNLCFLCGDGMTRNKQLAELARSLHRASERLWTRVADSSKYNTALADVENVQRLSTELNRAITKLRLKVTNQ
jgi:hypothetical protein